MKSIKVTINPEKNLIEVMNDGRGIPVEIHTKEKIYIPELIFGNLLTSSNYDDDEKKVTGGRNGYGAKLCNIFSNEFTVETADKANGKIYKQTWSNNMSKVGKPKITQMKKATEYTKISFKPDLRHFGMTELDEDILGVLRRRVYDVAGSVKDVAVYLNGTRLKIRNFKSYVDLFVKALERNKNDDDALVKKPTVVYERIGERWEVAFAISDGGFSQVSFVNSIATTSGGTHVTNVADQIVAKIQQTLTKKNKGAIIKPAQIRNNLFLFVNCLIENPAFTSQTKEHMTTRPSDFGSRCQIPDTLIQQILKTDLTSIIMDKSRQNADKELGKTDGAKRSRITGILKLDDANKAGTRESHKCTLILTEGDSAKSIAVAGLAVVGRDYYGVFPLRGKMLNVRDAGHEQIAKNVEIQAIKKIMGFKHKKLYTDVKDLRYGKIMIMTDQDYDGSHIKGLIINFIETSFPGLLQIPGFLIEFITPIVKVFVQGRKKEIISFYTMPEFETWVSQNGKTCTWTHKYYKGLGTSSPVEGREYFAALERHMKEFKILENSERNLIDLAFSKKRADDRKEWLKNFEPGTFLDSTLKIVPIGEFIDKELILFSMADNVRSIPSVLDGLKPAQRKVLFGCYKLNAKEHKVSDLAGKISSSTEYHHGDASLIQTIVALAQDFVGTNNIYIMQPKGSFGTRAVGGKDASAARYIFTALSSITKTIYNRNDDPILTYQQDDGKPIEPVNYVPIIPMVLVNGAEGIGTGYSTSIPSFHPLDLVKNIRRLMDGSELEEMAPWYRGWEGHMEKVSHNRYIAHGIITQVDDNTLEITELPVKTWTINMKQFLMEAMTGTDKERAWIKDMTEQHGIGIRFVITLSDEEMKKTLSIGLEERFKLTSTINLSNMIAFDRNTKLKKYDTAEDILKEFYYVRLEYYQKRKDYMAGNFKNQLDRLSAQARFIKLILDKKLTVNNRKKAEVINELLKLNFPLFKKDGTPVAYDDLIKKEEDDEEDAEELSAEEEDIKTPLTLAGSYDYLLAMPIMSLTRERYEKLMKQRDSKEEELAILLGFTPKDLWRQDLDVFEIEWEKFVEEDEAKRTLDTSHLAQGRKKNQRKRVKKEEDDEFVPGAAKKRKAITSKIVATKGKLKREDSTDDSSTTTLQKQKPSASSKTYIGKGTKKTINEFTEFTGKTFSPLKKSRDADVHDLDADELENSFENIFGSFNALTSKTSLKTSTKPKVESKKTDSLFVSRFGGDPIDLDSDSEMEDILPGKKKTTSTPKILKQTTIRAAPPKRKSVFDDEEEDDNSNASVSPPPKKANTSTRTSKAVFNGKSSAKSKPTIKKREPPKIVELSDVEDKEESEFDDEESEIIVPKSRARSTRAKKQVKYDFEEDDDEEDEEPESFVSAEEEDDDEFEL